jgi:NAD(P)-dependent dehydrogenase (short-subunit alcohol dehydrogenase family)
LAKRLEGRVAVVTGAGRGMGRAEALALAAEGAKVVVNDLGGAMDGTGASTSPSDGVVHEIVKLGGEAVSNYDSVATAEGCENIIRTAVDSFGGIDILVNNAGIIRDRMVYKMTEEEWDLVLKVHLYGHFYCTRAACVHFRQRRSGRIINTSSIAGLGSMAQANYTAAKEGILGFTRTVALDMGRYGVTCNAICPAAGTRINLTPEFWASVEKAKAQGLPMFDGGIGGVTAREELERLTPEMVAPMVVFLATDEAGDINGCTFSVSGGEIGIFREREVTSSIYKDGTWTLDELIDVVPRSLTKGLANPAPAQPPKG